MRTRTTAASAAAGLLVLVIGVPWFLDALGGGLPTSLPSAHQVHHFLGRPITDSAILRAVSLVCWALWALFVTAVATEAAARVRARPSPSRSHRGFRIPGVQAAAGALFLTALLLLPQRTSTAGPSAARSPIPLAHPPAAAAVLTGSSTSLAGHATVVTGPAVAVGASSAASDLAAGPVPGNWVPYTVKRYDTLWGIAEAHLGNPLRWGEIKDANGSTFATGTDDWVEVADHLIDEPQARLIFAGQQIWLPPDATGLTRETAPDPAVPTADPGPVTSPSKATSGTPAAPPATAASHGGPAGEAIIGQALDRSSPTSVPSRPPGAGRYDRITTGDTAGLVELSSAILASGMVAAAALSTIGRLRRRQSRATRLGRRVRLPGPHLAKTEMALRVAGSDDLLSDVHRAVRALAADLADASLDAPVVCGVLADDAGIEMLLDRPAQTPPGWEVTGEGFRWRTNRAEVSVNGWMGAEPLPILVPLGRVPGTSTEALLNLEAGGFIAVTGDPDATAGFVHAAAFSLAGLPWANAADIILVGFGKQLAAAEPHVRSVPRLEDAADDLRELAEVSHRAGTSSDSASTDGCPTGGETSLPTAVLCAVALDPDQRSWLRSLCESARISALVPDAASDDTWVIHVGDGPVLLPQLRIAVEPTCFPAADRDALDTIAAVGLDTDGASADEPPYDQLAWSAERDAPPADPTGNVRPFHIPNLVSSGGQGREHLAERPRHAVTVGVIGPVDFDGAGEFRRPRAKEIALYAAMHPEGFSERRLDEMIWPTHTEVKATTRDPAVSAARSALGGPDQFPYAQGQSGDKRYRLTEQVDTDWERFCWLHQTGRRAGDVEALREALSLVRGRPFCELDAGPGYEWLHLEGHIHHMEAEIADAADLAAGLLLAAGKPVEARWAANQGLLASPYSERLWVHLMAAADALGEAQEVERLLGEMDRRLGLDGDFESLHPDTVAGYRRYSRRNRTRVP